MSDDERDGEPRGWTCGQRGEKRKGRGGANGESGDDVMGKIGWSGPLGFTKNRSVPPTRPGSDLGQGGLRLLLFEVLHDRVVDAARKPVERAVGE